MPLVFTCTVAEATSAGVRAPTFSAAFSSVDDAAALAAAVAFVAREAEPEDADERQGAEVALDAKLEYALAHEVLPVTVALDGTSWAIRVEEAR